MLKKSRTFFLILAAISCARGSGHSDLNFTSANLQNFDAMYDLQLRPRPLTPSAQSGSRVFNLDRSIYELRYFKVDYAESSRGGKVREGNILRLIDIGGTGLPKDKMMDKIIPITTMVNKDQKIELPEGHYAAVICPRNMDSVRQCLSDPTPLNRYKDAVQDDQCGSIDDDGGNISERCKHMLFTGRNSFLAIAYPLTVKKVDGNNRFVSGDLELSYLPGSQRPTLSLLEDETPASCQEALSKASEEGLDPAVIAGACPDSGTGATGGTSMGDGNGSDSLSGNGMGSTNGNISGNGNGANPMGDFISNRMRGNGSPVGPGMGPMGPMRNFFRFGGLSGGDCFVAGTQILGVKKSDFSGATSRLSDLTIESIEAGDYVFNPLTQALVPVTSRTDETLPAGKSLYRLVQSGVEVTGVHPILIRKGLTFVANLFNSAENRTVSTETLSMMGSSLAFQAETIERKDTQAPFTVYNVKTDASKAVATAKGGINRSMLPRAFNCAGEFKPACENFVAVKSMTGQYLVAGEFIKQEILGDVMRGVSSASYQGAVGRLP